MAALLFGVLALLLVTAIATVSIIGTSSVTSFLLGVYAVAWVEIVSIALVLSTFRGFGRTGLVIGSLLALAIAVVAWGSLGRPHPPPLRPALRQLREELGDPVLAILAGTAALAAVYAVVIGIATPQNDWDALTYHLTRAALWIQQGSVSYVPNVTDVRINGNPPNAEIGQAWTMLLGGSDRFVWLPSLGAVPALMIGVFGISRRAGLDASGAVFGALLFGCLPLIVLQSPTAMNDLVVASFFVVATYFAIGTSRRGAVGAAVGLGLAFGTKISAPLLLPVYLLVTLVARRRRLREQCGIVILGVALGALWYGLNLFHTGSIDGGMAAAGGQVAGHQPSVILTRVYQLLQNTIELPGASPSRNRGLYVVAAILLVGAAAIAYLRHRSRASLSLVAAGAIVLVVPFALEIERGALARLWNAAWGTIGRDAPADELTASGVSLLSNSSSTWFGPVGAILIIGGVVLAVRGAADRRPLLLALSLAPLLFVAIVAVGLVWDPWRGRFFVFPVALAAAAWGIAHRSRALGWAALGLTVATVILTLGNSHTKPPGIRLLASATSPTVFGRPRWQVQALARDEAGTPEILEYAENHIPTGAALGLSLRQDDFIYPYFGSDLRRTVRFIAPGRTAPSEVDWIIEAPGHDVRRCEGSWEGVFETDNGFRVLRRTSTETC